MRIHRKNIFLKDRHTVLIIIIIDRITTLFCEQHAAGCTKTLTMRMNYSRVAMRTSVYVRDLIHSQLFVPSVSEYQAQIRATGVSCFLFFNKIHVMLQRFIDSAKIWLDLTRIWKGSFEELDETIPAIFRFLLSLYLV